jgi:hypothetical protein
MAHPTQKHFASTNDIKLFNKHFHDTYPQTIYINLHILIYSSWVQIIHLFLVHFLQFANPQYFT